MTRSSRSILWHVVICGGLLAALLVIILLTPNRSESSEAPSEKGSLKTTETSWDFGTVPMSQGVVTEDIPLSNSSSASVTVSELSTSCMCTKAVIVHADGRQSAVKGMVGHGGNPYLSEEIAGGETVTLRVTFDPAAHGPQGVGFIKRTVTLKTDNPSDLPIEVSFSANVVP